MNASQILAMRSDQDDSVNMITSDVLAKRILPATSEKVVRLPKQFDATTTFSAEELRAANIPESQWRGFHISTVLQLKKHDYLLSFQ